MTRVLLISDVHGNLGALDATLANAQAVTGFDQVWSMGDAVGYGPQPNECLARLRELDAIVVQGNHELAALGRISTADFNSVAAAAIEWTSGVLNDDSKNYLKSIPMRREIGNFTVLHGSPRDPIWEYVTDGFAARATVDFLNTTHCVHGHTHTPTVIPVDGNGQDQWPKSGQSLALNGERWFLNPGSVGQPRDNDPRASYAILDTKGLVITYFRVEYPIAETQELMKKYDLPKSLINRLEFGR